MVINDVIRDLLLEDPKNINKSKTLIFVLGDVARKNIEYGLCGKAGAQSSISAVIRSRQDIQILFLDSLQILFMYLMKFEANEDSTSIEHNRLIFYGFDILIKGVTKEVTRELSVEQVRLANLIYNASFRIRRKHVLKSVDFIQIVNENEDDYIIKELKRMEEYWNDIS